jgi:hypothetical protein
MRKSRGVVGGVTHANVITFVTEEFTMKKLFKAIAILGTIAALSTPAAAQITGELTVKSDNFSSFRALAAVDYTTSLGDNASLTFGVDYNLFFTSPSKAGVFAGGLFNLGSGLGAGLRADLSFSGIGASNTLGYSVTGFLFYNRSLVDQNNLYIDLFAEGRVVYNGAFGGGVRLDLDGGYEIATPLAAYFGISTKFGNSVYSGFVESTAQPLFGDFGVGLTGYTELDYLLSRNFKIFAGVDVSFVPFAFSDVYGGLRYDLNDQFSVRFTATYTGGNAVTLALSGLYNR